MTESRHDPWFADGRRADRWLGDALRAVRALGVSDPVEARAIIELLGAGSPSAAVGFARSEHLESAPDTSHSNTETRPEPAHPIGLGENRFARSQLVELEHGSPEPWSAQTTATALQEDTDTAWRQSPDTLFRADIERSIARELAAAWLPSNEMDIARLVDSVVHMELPVRACFAVESTTRRGLQLLLDRSARLDAVAHDVARLERRLTSLVANVEVLRFRDFPSLAGGGARDTWRAYRSPAPQVPVVVVTAFAGAQVSVWTDLVRQWARERRAVTFLVPHDADRVPGAVSALARVVVWDDAVTPRMMRRLHRDSARARVRDVAGSARFERDPVVRLERQNPIALRLAALASLASYVDPALLRALRRSIPNATTGAELDVWSSGVASSKGRDGIVLAANIVERLRARAKKDPLFDTALGLVREKHAKAPPLLRLEERVIAHSLEPGEAASMKITAELEGVIAAMQQSETRLKDLAHWFARASARLPASATQADAGRLLALVTTAHVSGAAAAPTPTRAVLARAAALVTRERTVPIAIRWRGGAYDRVVELKRSDGSTAGDPTWHTLAAASCDPLVLSVADNIVEIRPTGQVTHVTLGSAKTAIIRDASGHSWELAKDDDHSKAIAEVRSGSRRGIAYLVAPDLCVTSSLALDGDSAQLTFRWGTVEAVVEARSRRHQHWALLRLGRRVRAAPLPLGDDPHPEDEWEIALGPHTRIRGHGARLALEVGAQQRQVVLGPDSAGPVTLLPSDRAVNTLGAPVLVRGRVSGHLALTGPEGVVCPSSEVRTGWAESRASKIELVGHYVAMPDQAPSGPTVEPVHFALSLGRRTYLVSHDAHASLATRNGLVDDVVNRETFGETTLLVTRATNHAAPGPRRSMNAEIDVAQFPPLAIGLLYNYSKGTPLVAVPWPTFPTITLLPCPFGSAKGEPITLTDDRSIARAASARGHSRVFPGLPVFERDRLVGVTGLRRESGECMVRRITEVVRDLTPLLNARDWRRVQRSIESRGADYYGATPDVLTDALCQEGFDADLQFALDQSIRRLELRHPTDVRAPLLRASFAGENDAMAASDPVVRLWAVNYPRDAKLEFDIDGDNDLVRARGRDSVSFVARADARVRAMIYPSAAPAIELRALLCDLLDETYLGHGSSAIDDSIDRLRRGVDIEGTA